jgi:Methyltransferase domain
MSSTRKGIPLGSNNFKTSRLSTIFRYSVLISLNFWLLILPRISLPKDDLSPTHPVADIAASAVCPHALKYFSGNIQEINNAIEKSNEFHYRGGNLDAIQDYLDRHIDSSFEKLQLTFKPKGYPEQTKPRQWLNEYLRNNTLPRNGYDRNLPFTFEGFNVDALGGRDVLGGNNKANMKRVISVLEPFSEERFSVGMGPMGPNCTGMRHFKEKYFCEGWDSKEAPCNIFSIGSNNDWSFELAIVEQAPHCIVHTFDCTLRKYLNHKKGNGSLPFVLEAKPKDDRIMFYPNCIGSTSEGDYLTYYDMLKISKVTGAPRILKMDIEGFEYKAIKNLLRETPQEMWPEQIVLEVHWASRMVQLSWMLRGLQASELSLFFSLLYATGGYMPVSREFYPALNSRQVGCISCMEVVLVRVLCQNPRLTKR